MKMGDIAFIIFTVIFSVILGFIICSGSGIDPFNEIHTITIVDKDTVVDDGYTQYLVTDESGMIYELSRQMSWGNPSMETRMKWIRIEIGKTYKVRMKSYDHSIMEIL